MEEEWEVCNDGGFIYKRRRRLLPPPPSPVLHHPSEVEAHGRTRRSVALAKIRDRYSQEVALWEHIADACRSMTDNAEREKTRGSSCEASSSRREEVSATEMPETSNLLDKLLLQAEQQEAIIRDLTQMCDRAEALCKAQEEQFRDSLLQLPIWAPPQELMAALCDKFYRLVTY
ncbi:hypothetical protein MLD38_001378 [Melastoma candidum]|uniref:Uncharacterized protein n=1 Tax=Melastoma candidum TaxID=119954 RepID=A0ACB9SCE6_9MYRT|nr:hypothetical protein MLD38_001378 [Melastoma candidum]